MKDRVSRRAHLLLVGWVALGAGTLACGRQRNREVPDAAPADSAQQMDTAPQDLRPDGVGRIKCASSGGAFGDPANPWKNPKVRCYWAVPGHAVHPSPLVVDLDADGKPEIVFSSLGPDALTYLHAIRGSDCSGVWTVTSKIEETAELAAGDLDGDGKPEIVGHGFGDIFIPPPMGKPSPPGPGSGMPLMGGYVLHAYSAVGDYLGQSDPLPDGPYVASGPAIADVDGVAPAEIVFAAGAYRLDVAGKKIEKLWDKSTRQTVAGILSLAADLDLDGLAEVVTGNRIYGGDSAVDLSPMSLRLLPPGYAAVAQIDETTAEPELVVASSPLGREGRITALEAMTGRIVFGPYDIPNLNSASASAGPPVVADFDGDGQAEFGLAAPDDYRMYDPGCVGMPLPPACAGPGLRWTSRTMLLSTGTPSSTVFDFNGDCTPEVVYRDMCWLRIYDGRTGKVLAVAPINGFPHLEQPVVADADGDGHADIVVSSSLAFGCPMVEEYTKTPRNGDSFGVFVLSDPDDRWVGSRGIWNQHTYHVTNVDEAGTVPLAETKSWDVYNNYRQNVPKR